MTTGNDENLDNYATQNETEVVTDDYDNYAFVNLRSSTVSTANSQLLQGKISPRPGFRPEVEYALHHRNYDPKIERFKSEDPA